MTIAAALLAGAIIVGWLVPKQLQRLTAGRLNPLVLLICWFLTIAGVLVTVSASAVLLVIPDHGVGNSLVAVLHSCWSSVRHGSTPRTEELVGLAGSFVFLALVVHSTIIGVRAALCRARQRRDHLSVLRLAARTEDGPPTTLWLDHDQPLAFSVAGRPGVVVATEGLARRLSSTELAAVLAHERAHLHGRHHLLVAAADALAAALPIVPLFQRVPGAVRELVELVADATAVRMYGVEAVRAALLGVSGRGAPGPALAMARDAVELRITRLNNGGDPVGRTRRVLTCAAAATTAFALPLLAGTWVLVTIAAVACP